MSPEAEQPRVLIEPGPCRPGTEHGEWLTSWRIRNLSAHRLDVQAARLLFDRFRSSEPNLAASVRIGAGASGDLEIKARCAEPAGTVLKSPFLILVVRWHDQDWRLFCRLRVEFDDDSTPRPICEAVTAQAIAVPEGQRE